MLTASMARRAAGILNIHRIIQAIELSVLILIAAVADTIRGDLLATRVLLLACLIVAALMVVGDGNGKVGLGYGKAKEAGLAVQKGIEEARKNLFEVPLAGNTIVHPVIGESGAGRVMLKPAAPGTGVIAGGAARAILEMAGIRDILAKSLGSSNGINVAHATIAGLKALRRPDEVAALRGKQADEVTPAGVLRAYRERRRETDLFAGEAR